MAVDVLVEVTADRDLRVALVVEMSDGTPVGKLPASEEFRAEVEKVVRENVLGEKGAM